MQLWLGWSRVLVGALTLVFVPLAHADKAKAREFYRAGQQNYNLTDYEKALASFTAGYREQEDPEFLFNIAQCHRQLGHKTEAIKLYRSYLRQRPNTSVDVKSIIARLENELQLEQSNKNQPPYGPSTLSGDSPPIPLAPTPTVTPVQTSTAIVGPAPRKPIYKKAWFWGSVAGGAVVVGGAIALGVVFGVRPANPNATFGTVTVP